MTIRDEPIMKLASMLLVTNPRAVSQGPTWQIILSKYNRNQGFANRLQSEKKMTRGVRTDRDEY